MLIRVLDVADAAVAMLFLAIVFGGAALVLDTCASAGPEPIDIPTTLEGAP